MKTNNRIKLIVLSVSMLTSLGSFATDNSANQNGNQVAAAHARQPIRQTGGQYEVRPGETLNQIAARVRPNNMSLSETANAIVRANPDIFKNGNPNLIFAGDVLRIPTSSQISGTPASSTQSKSAAPAATEQPAKTASAQTAKPESDNKPASAKTESKSDAANSGKTAQSKPDNTTASAVGASVTAPAATTASQETTATASPASQSSGGSSLPWILVGGIGLAALLFLNKFRGNKQAKENAAATPAPQSSDKTPVSEKTSAAATAAVVTAAATASDDIETSDNDFSETTEDIFFSDVDPRADEAADNDDFNLDLSAIGNQQDIVSSAVTTDEETLKRADADWGNIESTDSVYEDDVSTTTFKKTVVADEDEVEEKSAAVEDSVIEAVEFTEPEAIDDGEEEVLEFDAASSIIEVPEPVVEESVVGESTEAEPDNKPTPETVIETEQAVESTADEDSPLEFEPVSVEPVIPEAVVEQTTEKESAENIETVAVFAETTTEEPTSHNWGLEAVEEAVETPEVEASPIKTAAEEPISYNWTPEKETAEELEAEDSVFDTIEALQDNQEENFSAARIAITEASDDDVIEWDSVDFADDDKEVGFISESVGMTAPLEAKYELAQMYIEIGDPDAARETLNELLEEASGDILAKSKALLAEIS